MTKKYDYKIEVKGATDPHAVNEAVMDFLDEDTDVDGWGNLTFTGQATVNIRFTPKDLHELVVEAIREAIGYPKDLKIKTFWHRADNWTWDREFSTDEPTIEAQAVELREQLKGFLEG